MRIKIINGLVLLVFLLSACSGGGGTGPTIQPTATTIPPLPTARMTIVSAPDPRVAAQEFLDDWRADKYSQMYDLLTSVGKDAITRDKFVQRFTDVAVGLTLQEVNYDILQACLLY